VEDTDPWTGALDASPGSWTAEVRVQFDPDDETKTIPLALAQEMLQRQFKSNPGSFANKVADVYRSWALGANGSDRK
jgi:hypothetical protein